MQNQAICETVSLAGLRGHPRTLFQSHGCPQSPGVVQSWAEQSGSWYHSLSLSASMWGPFGESGLPRCQGCTQALPVLRGHHPSRPPTKPPVLASGSVHCQQEQRAICLRQREPSLTVTPSRGPHFKLGLITVPAVLSQGLYLPIAFIGIWFHVHESLPSFSAPFFPSLETTVADLLWILPEMFCG